MKSLRFLDRRVGYSLASIGLLLGVVAPAALPAFASADVLTSRSLTMSSSAPSASASYTVQFTLTTAIAVGGGFLMQFCDSSSGPLAGSACVEPTGMSISTLTQVSAQKDVGSGFVSTTSTGTLTSQNETNGTAHDNYVKWVSGTGDALAATNKLKLSFSGVTNPSTTGTFYARIYTYAPANITSFSSSTSLGTVADNGSLALSTSNSVGVTAYVLESMTFCVSKGDVGNTGNLTANSTQAAPSQNCGSGESSCPGSGCVTAPTFTLGQVSGTVTSLDSTHVSTGSVYAQLSTNASGGAIVNLKSNAVGCGGLFRNGVSDSAHCNIGPQTTPTTSTVTAGTAGFGVLVGSSAAAALPNGGGAGTGTGTLQAATNYDSSHAYINYVNGDATGVTSTYGDALLTTNGTQTNNLNIPVTFEAAISPTTPAGVYGATFNMIATGTF